MLSSHSSDGGLLFQHFRLSDGPDGLAKLYHSNVHLRASIPFFLKPFLNPDMVCYTIFYYNNILYYTTIYYLYTERDLLGTICTLVEQFHTPSMACASSLKQCHVLLCLALESLQLAYSKAPAGRRVCALGKGDVVSAFGGLPT